VAVGGPTSVSAACVNTGKAENHDARSRRSTTLQIQNPIPPSILIVSISPQSVLVIVENMAAFIGRDLPGLNGLLGLAAKAVNHVLGIVFNITQDIFNRIPLQLANIIHLTVFIEADGDHIRVTQQVVE